MSLLVEWPFSHQFPGLYSVLYCSMARVTSSDKSCSSLYTPHGSSTLTVIKPKLLHLAHVGLHFPTLSISFVCLALLIILSIPRLVITLCLSPSFTICKYHSLPFSTWQTLNSPLTVQFSVAWLGLWKSCSEEKHFCRWLPTWVWQWHSLQTGTEPWDKRAPKMEAGGSLKF